MKLVIPIIYNMDKLTFFFVILGLLFCERSSGAEVLYKGHEVIRLEPKGQEQVQAIKNLNTAFIDTVWLWSDYVVSGVPVLVQVEPSSVPDVIKYLKMHGIKHVVTLPDLQEAINNQKQAVHNNQHTRATNETFFEQYHTLEEIEKYLADVVATSGLATMEVIAKSYEGRDIRLLKLSSDRSANRRVIWLDSAIHAREWVAPATTLFYINYLTTRYGNDQTVTSLLDTFDFYILPVFNVDGYEFTWTDNRLWRKTRSPNEGSICFGADPNRNFDIEWGTVGVSTNPCSDQYPGSRAFSEVEVQQVAEYVARVDPIAYLAYHSFGQMYMLPYGYTQDKAPDYSELMRLCQELAVEMFGVHGKNYVCDSLINLVGPNSGSSADYTYGVLNIKYSFGVELRDRGMNGFVLPPEQIVPTAEENLVFLLGLATYIKEQETL